MGLQPSYYTTLPSPVRYCNEITAEAKLFYAELNAITPSRVLVIYMNDLYIHFAKYMDLPSFEVDNLLLELQKNNFIILDTSLDNRRIISIK